MERGHQKCKRPPHMEKFRREVVQDAEENGNHKVAAVFQADENNV
jgi:hypothetical protein